VADALTALGFPEFTIQINDRRIITGLAKLAGVADDQAGQVYRSIDKIEKIGPGGVRAELIERGVAADSADRVLDLVTMRGSDAEVLAALRGRAAGFPDVVAGADDLERLLGFLGGLGVSRENYTLQLSMVRGLDYYTGPVFEIAVERPKVGSIGGGRALRWPDRLVQRARCAGDRLRDRPGARLRGDRGVRPATADPHRLPGSRRDHARGRG
jgi:histidyl-tRNA synthetase